MRKPVAVVVNETPINLCGQCEKIASAWVRHHSIRAFQQK